MPRAAVMTIFQSSAVITRRSAAASWTISSNGSYHGFATLIVCRPGKSWCAVRPIRTDAAAVDRDLVAGDVRPNDQGPRISAGARRGRCQACPGGSGRPGTGTRIVFGVGIDATRLQAFSLRASETPRFSCACASSKSFSIASSRFCHCSRVSLLLLGCVVEVVEGELDAPWAGWEQLGRAAGLSQGDEVEGVRIRQRQIVSLPGILGSVGCLPDLSLHVAKHIDQAGTFPWKLFHQRARVRTVPLSSFVGRHLAGVRCVCDQGLCRSLTALNPVDRSEAPRMRVIPAGIENHDVQCVPRRRQASRDLA